MAQVSTFEEGIPSQDAAYLKPQGSSSGLAADEMAKGVRDMVPSPPGSMGDAFEEDKNMSSVVSEQDTAVGEELDHHTDPVLQEEKAARKANTPPRTQSFSLARGVVTKQEQPINVMAVSNDDDDEMGSGGDYIGSADAVDEEHGLDNGLDASQNNGDTINDEASEAAIVKALPPSWHALSSVLPIGQTEEEKLQRLKLFQRWDPNGNGLLSLAEIDKGVRETPGLEQLYKCKPAMIRAYNAAKALKPADPSKRGLHDDDYVSKIEFRMLLVYLKLYFGLSLMYDTIDTGGDRRVDLDEFRAAAPILREWGCPIKNVDEVFEIVDQDKGGQILFDEFSEWAIGNNVLVRSIIEAKQSAITIQSLARGARARMATAVYRSKAAGAATAIQKRARGMRARRDVAHKREVEGGAAVKIQSRARGIRDRKWTQSQRHQKEAAVLIQSRARGMRDRKRVIAMRSGAVEEEDRKEEGGQEREEEEERERVEAAADPSNKLPEEMKGNWRVVAHKLPWRKAQNDKMARAWLFKRWDTNGNGHLSLAEIDKGVHETPGLEGLNSCKPAIIRAYIAAKSLKAPDPNKKGQLADDDYVTRIEFRMLLVFLSVYYGLFQIFDQIDTGHDRRVNIDEFRAAAPALRELGCPLGQDLDAAFKRVDKDGGGQILFNEFCDWAMLNNILVNPSAADKVSEKPRHIPSPAPPNRAPAQILVQQVAMPGGGSIARKSLEQDRILQDLLASYQQLEAKLGRQTEAWSEDMQLMRRQIMVAIENQQMLRTVSDNTATLPSSQTTDARAEPKAKADGREGEFALNALDPVRQPAKKQKKLRATAQELREARERGEREERGERREGGEGAPPMYRSVSEGSLVQPYNPDKDETERKPKPRRKAYLVRSRSEKAPVWRGWDWKREEGVARQELIQRTSSDKHLSPPRLVKKARPQPAVSKSEPLPPMVFGQDEHRSLSQKNLLAHNERGSQKHLLKNNDNEPKSARSSHSHAPQRASSHGAPPPLLRVSSNRASELRAKAARSAQKDLEMEELEQEDLMAKNRRRPDAKDRLVMGQMKMEANTERGSRMIRPVPSTQSAAIPYEWS